MDQGELDFSDHETFLSCDSLVDVFPSSGLLDELLKNTHTCTHTHTCNLPGPDKEHTHTCYHTHTQLFTPAEEDDLLEKSQEAPVSVSKKRPLGNKEAVRKYREKKKAHTAYLEEQVTHLRLLNQQLMKKIQSQAALEAEVIRLRSLLSEFKGRIDWELGTFPRPNTCVEAVIEAEKVCSVPADDYRNSTGTHCAVDVPCLHSPMLADGNSDPQQPTELLKRKGACNVVNSGCTCNKMTEKCHTLKTGHGKRAVRGSASGKDSGLSKSSVAD